MHIRLFIPTALLLATFPVTAVSQPAIRLALLDRYETGIFAQGAAEIVAHDAMNQQLFVANRAEAAVDVLDISDPTHLSLAFTIDVTPFGRQANSVAVHDDRVAIAVEATNKQEPGSVVFFDTRGSFLTSVIVGALPDMITFTPDGNFVLVANEGEPSDDYSVDPEGSVSVIDLRHGMRNLGQHGVRTAGFSDYDNAVLDPSTRVFGPGASVAQDMEPEFIAVSDDSRRAWVSLQENNSIAEIDIYSARVTSLRGLGFKDHGLAGNGFDASDEDSRINIAQWPVLGMYQPDALAHYRAGGVDYIVTASEGESRTYQGFREEARVADLVLSPVFGSPTELLTLQSKENLGRLRTTLANGDADRDGVFENIYSFGTRSFSIWDTSGNLIYDSADEFERIIGERLPDDFSSHDEWNGSFDDRSDDMGPEPEGVSVGRVGSGTYAFIVLEKVGGIMIFDITDPFTSHFVDYVNTRDFTGDLDAGTTGDVGPEGVVFVDGGKSPIHVPLLVASYEVSGTTAVYRIDENARASRQVPAGVGAGP